MPAPEAKDMNRQVKHWESGIRRDGRGSNDEASAGPGLYLPG